MIAKAKKEGVFPGDEKKFLSALADVRNEGFAASNQEERAGIVAVAVPIFSSKGVAGAINLIAEPEEVPIDVLKTDYAPKLMKIGSQLSEALGYRG